MFSQELPPEPGTSAWEGRGSDRSTRDLHAPVYRFDDEPPDPAEAPTGQRSDRDLPLSFCWTAATNWTAILDLPPLPMKHQEARNAILLEAVLAHHWNYPAVSYGRRRAFYAKKQRYHGSAFMYAIVPPTVDDLERRGLLECWTAPSLSYTGVQSTFRASPQLLQAASSMLMSEIVQVPRELVRLRDSNKHLLDYRDNRRTDRMRRILAEQNEAIQATSIGLLGRDVNQQDQAIGVNGAMLYLKRKALYRVFNENFRQGGRIYGGWWQYAPKADRRQITLDGEPIVELDYAQLHPRLLYWCSGRQQEGDAYTLPGWERDEAKLAFNVLINANSYPKAVGAIAKDLKGSDRGRQAAQLIAALKDRHRAIARFFHSGAGVKLQAVDADMAERVLVELLKQNVVTLPIHDSFIVQKGHEAILRQAMDAAYERVVSGRPFF